MVAGTAGSLSERNVRISLALRVIVTLLVALALVNNFYRAILANFIAARDWSLEALIPVFTNGGYVLGILLLFYWGNKKLGSPRSKTSKRRREEMDPATAWAWRALWVTVAYTGIAYVLGFVVTIPMEQLNLWTAFAWGAISGTAKIFVFVIPLICLYFFAVGPPFEGKGLYQGQFADVEAIEPLRLDRDGKVPGDALLVGMTNEGTPEQPVIEPLVRRPGFGEQRELGHGLFVYPSRKGKGLQLITQGLFWQGSMVFVDPKGEFAGTLAHYRRGMGQAVFILDPSFPDLSNRYDPFADLGDTPEALRSAAKLILEPPPNSREPPYFAQRATNGLVAALRAAKLAQRPGLPYLYEVKRRGLAHFIRTLAKVKDDVVMDNLTDFLGRHPSEMPAERIAKDERLVTIWSTLNTRTADLLQPGVREVASGCDFRARDLVVNDKPVTLFLTFRESEIEATKAFLRLTILALVTDLIRIGDTRAEEMKHKLLLGFDEAGRIPVPRLPDLVSTTSSRGISALIYVQDLAQLDAAYGREQAATIRSNCDTQVYYRPTDTLTAKYVADRAGKTSVKWLNTSNTVSETNSSETASWTWKDRELISVSEFMQLPEGLTLAFVGNLPPIVANRVDFRLLETETAKLDALNAKPFQLTRPSEPAVRYAEPDPEEPREPRAPAKAPTNEPRAKSKEAEAPSSSPRPETTSPEPAKKKKRQRTRKRKATQPEAEKPQGSGKIPEMRPTYPSSLEAAIATLRAQGGDVERLTLTDTTVTGTGVPCKVYSDGKEQVAVCEVRGTGHYFAASPQELGLEAAKHTS